MQLNMMIKNFVIITFAFFISCTGVERLPLDESTIYKMDINIKNKEFDSIGMIVLPKKLLYTIEFETDDKIRHISFVTCSREITDTNPSTNLSKKKFTINYRPNEIELEGNCPAHIQAFNEKAYSVGFIDFLDDSVDLEAINICGEKTTQNLGASVCQGKIGTKQRIKFNVEVVTAPIKGCELESGNIGREFSYNIKKDFCDYIFVEKKLPNRRHRLTTYGYEQIQVKL